METSGRLDCPQAACMSCIGWILRSLTLSSKLLLYSRPINQAITAGFASHDSDKYQNLWSDDFDSIYSLKMPKNKEYSSSDASSNSSSEDEKPKKKQKTEKAKPKEDKAESSKKTKGSSKADEKEPCWSLGSNKQIKIRTFKGKLYVDVREYYEEDGELRPGKKGISMPAPVFEEFMKVIHEVEDVFKIKAGN